MRVSNFEVRHLIQIVNWVAPTVDFRIKLIVFGVGSLFIGYFLYYTTDRWAKPPTNSSSPKSSDTATIASNPSNSPNIWSMYQENVPVVLVGENFCSSWDIKDAVRDLFQNAMDSMLATHRLAHQFCSRDCSHWISTEKPPSLWDEKKEWVLPFFLYSGTEKSDSPIGYICWKPDTAQGPVLTLINLNATFSPHALVVGSTTKKDHSQNAGGHGEGLKAIAAVVCRKKLQFELFHTNVVLKFYQEGKLCLVKCQKNDSKLLEFSELSQEYKSRLGLLFERDVIAHVGKSQNLTFKDLQEAASKFLSLTHRQVSTIPTDEPLNSFKPVVVYSIVGHNRSVSTKRSLLKGSGLNNKFYVLGIHFADEITDQLTWGLNLAREDAHNRDRNHIDHYTTASILAQGLASLLELSCSEEIAREILQEYLAAFQGRRLPYYLELFPNYAQQRTRSIITKLFVEAHPKTRFVSSKDGNTIKEDKLFPRWCDESVFQVVHPKLYALIERGFPSPIQIRLECQNRLFKKPLSEKDTKKLKEWIAKNQHFLLIDQSLKSNKNYLGLVEVRDSDTSLDVPQFLITENPSRLTPFKLIFSYRTTKLDTSEDQFEFLMLMREAFRELLQKLNPTKKLPPPVTEAKPQVSSSPPITPPVQSLPKPVTQNPTPSPQIPTKKTDVSNLFSPLYTDPTVATEDVKVPDCATDIPYLTETILIDSYNIPSTADSAQLWKTLRSVPKFNNYASRAIKLCVKAVQLLCGSDKPLRFYIHKISHTQGFANRDAININLGSLIDLASQPHFSNFKSGELKRRLMSYFLILIAHEHAHFVKDTDGHSPDHGRRMEHNIKKLIFHWPELENELN